MVGPIRHRDLVLRGDVTPGFILDRHVGRVALGEELVQSESEQRSAGDRVPRRRTRQQCGADGLGTHINGAASEGCQACR